MEARQDEGRVNAEGAEGAEVRGEDGHPGLGVGKLDAWGRWVVRVVKLVNQAGDSDWFFSGPEESNARTETGEVLSVRRLPWVSKLIKDPPCWALEVTRGAGFKIVANADGVSREAAQLMAMEMALVMQVGCKGWAAEKARFFEVWNRGEFHHGGTESTEGEEGSIQRRDAEGAEGAEAAGFERGVAAVLDVFERIGFSKALMKDVTARVAEMMGTTEHTEDTEFGQGQRDAGGTEDREGEFVEAGLPVPEVVLSGGAGFGDVYPAWLWDRVPAREVEAVAEVLEDLVLVVRSKGMTVSDMLRRGKGGSGRGLSLLVKGCGPEFIEIENISGGTLVRTSIDREVEERAVFTESGQGQRDAGGTEVGK